MGRASATGGFTRAELVREAKAAGYEVTERLITDWSSLGLLDHPVRRSKGTGGGRGATYLYPPTQRDLFLSLLQHRGSGQGVARLTVIPVGVWLLWGDEFVGLPQVRRALSTWVGGVPWERSAERAQQMAKKAVRELAESSADPEAKAALEAALADVVYNRHFDKEQISPLVRAVVDPKGTGRRHGPIGQSVEEVTEFLGSLITGMTTFEHAEKGAFIEARMRYRQTVASYTADWPRLSSADTIGTLFERPTLEFFMNRACRDLLTHLGLRQVATGTGRELPPLELVHWTRPPVGLPISDQFPMTL
ncbi:MAG: hypothetical protein ACLPR9_06190 [Acidimicrobiales bacterium]